MKKFGAIFTIVKENNCPLYEVDEQLRISDKTLSCPKGKEMCLTIVRDLTELLFEFLQEQSGDLDDYIGTVFNCSGCKGLIKFSLVKPGELREYFPGSGAAIAQIDSVALKRYGNIVICSLLKALPPNQVEIVLGKNCEVQLYIAQLLAGRLMKNNAALARYFESSMSGRIDEIVPTELSQIFHMHQKTGVLSLELPGRQAKVSFCEGYIINAGYRGLFNQEAIFKILSEKKGFYRFNSGLSPSEMKATEIGDFMMLLMEGVKRVDEEQDR